MWVLFLTMEGAVLVYLVSGNLRVLRYDPGALLLQMLMLIPVSLFFATLATLILWYLFRMLLPGLLRFRRLRMIRYQRSLRVRDHEQDLNSQ